LGEVTSKIKEGKGEDYGPNAELDTTLLEDGFLVEI
jgi:hypothetical protein